ncbi:MAG TPA: oligosaccharide flippase family protein [Steroidobacteraceae bacterium]|nr:oligosaccharide flippase family protein [Steroidobacteraceae bacterium]
MSIARVFRSAGLVVVARVIAAPVSILVNAVAARFLGASDFGLLYQALTFSSFVFLFVEWGQPNVLMAQVATRSAAAGELLGSGIASRVSAAVIAGGTVPWICALAGYDREFVLVLSLTLLVATFATVSGACQDVLRGFERADVAAGTFLGWQLLSAAIVVPTLLLGGGLYGLLIAQAGAAAAGLVFLLKMLPRMQVPRPRVRIATVKALLRDGRPFVVFGVVLASQPLVDAAMLSKLAAPQAMGWYGAALKLIGALIFPASALILALYPTLCRLRMESVEAFTSTAAEALYVVAIAAVPLALGCALFPELGVALFGQHSYGPAVGDLRILALYVFLVYFSMPIGSCLVAAGRQNAWTLVQAGCVIVSLVLDPPLIHWSQAHWGNGGLGVCVAAVVSEIMVVSVGATLLPAGVLTKIPRAKIGLVLACALAMAAVATALSSLDELVRACLAVLAYAGCLQICGAFDFLKLRTFLGGLRAR